MYAKSKLAGEDAVRSEIEDSLIVHTNIYGWNMQQGKQSLAEWILKRFENGEAVPGFHDVTFTPILVNDLSDVILDMIGVGLKGLYHVAGSEPCSKYDFALRLAEIFGFQNALVRLASIEDSLLKAPRPKNTSLKTEKVSQELGRMMPDLNSGIRHFNRLLVSGFAARLKTLGGGGESAKI
ncbi:MAG: sugar nucleotide-binding protein [Candidatus Methanoperedenaceae archaeon]|nr:sugar nucleotide-binding protein [Candidatus Methanoperedenaceae archaeon]